MGGKVVRRYLADAHRYDRGRGWSRVADLPRPVVAAPSPAMADASGLSVFGGDDGSQVGGAPEKHRGFDENIFRFNLKTGSWTIHGESPAPRATVPLTRRGSSWVIPSGEVRPGVRSPEVWSFSPR